MLNNNSDKTLSIKEVLNQIHNYKYDYIICNDPLYREENYKTIIKYNLTKQDIIEYIELLKTKHYIKRILCLDSKYKCDYLYEFIMNTNLTDEYGYEKLVKLYIKIGFHNKQDKIYIVSFHESN